MTSRQLLTVARNGVTKSRGASHRAKSFLDAGYANRQYRDDAVEELRQSVEQLIEVVEQLIGEENEEKYLPEEVVPRHVESEMKGKE